MKWLVPYSYVALVGLQQCWACDANTHLMSQCPVLRASLGFEDQKDQILVIAVITFAIWSLESLFEYLLGVEWRCKRDDVLYHHVIHRFTSDKGESPLMLACRSGTEGMDLVDAFMLGAQGDDPEVAG